MRPVTHLETKAILKKVADATTQPYSPGLLTLRRLEFQWQLYALKTFGQLPSRCDAGWVGSRPNRLLE